MKTIFVVYISLIILSSCASSKEAQLSGSERRDEKKVADAEAIRQAVESGKFIIKLDRLYVRWGGILDLKPSYNYIILNGDKAIIQAAYAGRQHGIRPIAGINLSGKPINLEITRNPEKDKYELSMKVTRGGDTFDVNLNIFENGSCNASLSSIKIDHVEYSGQIVPIKDKVNYPESNDIQI